MSDTAIEWVRNPDGTHGKVWNPVVGCTKKSAGCKNCWAKTLHDRRHAAYLAGKQVPVQYAKPFEEVQLLRGRLNDPLHWKTPQRVFLDSMSDLFHPDVPDGFVMDVWRIMGLAWWHTFIILTKRADRMHDWLAKWADFLEDNHEPLLVRGPEKVRESYQSGRAKLFADMLDLWGEPPAGCAYPAYDWMEGMRWWQPTLPNVWLLVSVEDQKAADERIPLLLDTPAAVRGISGEPLLEAIDIWKYLGHYCHRCHHHIAAHEAITPISNSGCLYCDCQRFEDARLDWVITGAESGKDARPMDIAWARSLQDQCQAAGAAFFFKQAVIDGKMVKLPELDGRKWAEFPERLCFNPVTQDWERGS